MSNDEGQLTDVELEELEELNEKDEDELSDGEVTSKIKLSVKRRFDYPTWIMVFEFQNREGRRADCLALNTMPSRNHKLVGYEFKASRNDWLQEKKEHDKADFFVQLCDEWYVVAGRRGIVEEEELPEGWGLLELKPSGSLWKLVESDLPDCADKELDRHFFAKFMKKAVGHESNFTHSDIKEAKRRGYDEAMGQAVENEIDYETRQLKRDAENFEKLREAGLKEYTEMSDEKVERLQRAHNLLKSIEDDSYTRTLQGRLKSLKKGVKSDAERMIGLVDELEEELGELQEEVNND